MAKPFSYEAAHRIHRAALAGKPCEHCTLEVALKPNVPADKLLVGAGRYAGLLYTLDSAWMVRLCVRHHRLSDSRQRRIPRPGQAA